MAIISFRQSTKPVSVLKFIRALFTRSYSYEWMAFGRPMTMVGLTDGTKDDGLLMQRRNPNGSIEYRRMTDEEASAWMEQDAI